MPLWVSPRQYRDEEGSLFSSNYFRSTDSTFGAYRKGPDPGGGLKPHRIRTGYVRIHSRGSIHGALCIQSGPLRERAYRDVIHR